MFFLNIKNPKSLNECRLENLSEESKIDYYQNCSNLKSVSVNCIYPNGTIIPQECEFAYLRRLKENSILIKSFKYIFEYENPDGISKARLNIELYEDEQESTILPIDTTSPEPFTTEASSMTTNPDILTVDTDSLINTEKKIIEQKFEVLFVKVFQIKRSVNDLNAKLYSLK